MLSYQHIYHAGNPADVHKHAALCWMLDYMTAKAKPMVYIETHAGRGLYDLDAPEARRTGEAAAGVGRALDAGVVAPDHPYAVALARVRAAHGGRAYGGSPVLAATLLRDGDRVELAELHPREHAALAAVTAPDTRVRVHKRDGFDMAHGLCPPTPRRGLMLIDPSYEVKADYDAIPGQVARLVRKWNVGVVCLWYPILSDARHAAMLAALERLGLPGALRHELRFAPVRRGHRMVGSGLYVVNAPFGLAGAMAELSARWRDAGLSAGDGRR